MNIKDIQEWDEHMKNVLPYHEYVLRGIFNKCMADVSGFVSDRQKASDERVRAAITEAFEAGKQLVYSHLKMRMVEPMELEEQQQEEQKRLNGLFKKFEKLKRGKLRRE